MVKQGVGDVPSRVHSGKLEAGEKRLEGLEGQHEAVPQPEKLEVLAEHKDGIHPEEGG